MARARKASGANVSFFSFQDIITSVTGILLLIVIFLILQLTKPGLLPSAIPVPDVSLEELKERIALGLEKIKEIEEIKLKASGKSEEDLKLRIAELREALAEEAEKSDDADARIQVEKTEAEMKEITNTVTELTIKKSELEGEAEKIRGQVESKANGIAEAENSSKIWLHRGASSLEPLLLDVREDKAILRRFSNPKASEEMAGADMLPAFNRLVQDSNKTSSYFVFLVRPKGIANFNQFRAMALGSGFSVGFHPIDGETEIDIAPD